MRHLPLGGNPVNACEATAKIHPNPKERDSVIAKVHLTTQKGHPAVDVRWPDGLRSKYRVRQARTDRIKEDSSHMKTFSRMTKLAVILLLILLLGVGLSCGGSRGVAAKKAPAKKPAAARVQKPACLDCHGPYPDLVAEAPTVTIKDGSKVNPHWYVPHETKTVPDCALCHEDHPLPPEEIETTRNIYYCFSCHHHREDFTPCNNVICHPKPVIKSYLHPMEVKQGSSAEP